MGGSGRFMQTETGNRERNTPNQGDHPNAE
jgi:hypothetical protein